MSYTTHNETGVFESCILLLQSILKSVSLSESDTPIAKWFAQSYLTFKDYNRGKRSIV